MPTIQGFEVAQVRGCRIEVTYITVNTHPQLYLTLYDRIIYCDITSTYEIPFPGFCGIDGHLINKWIMEAYYIRKNASFTVITLHG